VRSAEFEYVPRRDLPGQMEKRRKRSSSGRRPGDPKRCTRCLNHVGEGAARRSPAHNAWPLRSYGGRRHVRPERVTPELLVELETLIPLAPLHQPHNLVPIRAALALDPSLPQIVCFGTAFHRSLPDVAQAFALTRELHDEGICRYGFHGLSYMSILLPCCRHAHRKSLMVVLWWPISAMALHYADSTPAFLSLQPWASVSWTACPWGPAAERSTPA